MQNYEHLDHMFRYNFWFLPMLLFYENLWGVWWNYRLRWWIVTITKPNWTVEAVDIGLFQSEALLDLFGVTIEQYLSESFIQQDSWIIF